MFRFLSSLALGSLEGLRPTLPSDFVGDHHLVAAELVHDFGELRERYEAERVPEEVDALPLREVLAAEELPLELLTDGEEDRFDSRVVVVQHRRLVGGTVHDPLGVPSWE